MNLTAKKLVITGASGGIGGAIARALAQQGCQLLLVGRNTGKLQASMEALAGSGHSMLVADLKSAKDRAALVEEATAFEASGLVNGVGTNQLRLLEATADQDVEDILATNMQIPMLLCRDFVPLLKRSARPVIVNIGSILGSIGYAGSTVYCASKFGLRGFTESLRRELADSNIKVIYFAPRATNTELNSDEMQQLNEALGNTIDDPEWVANMLVKMLKKEGSATLYLGSPEAFFVRLNGLFPSLVDKALFKQLPIIRRFSSLSNQPVARATIGDEHEKAYL